VAVTDGVAGTAVWVAVAVVVGVAVFTAVLVAVAVEVFTAVLVAVAVFVAVSGSAALPWEFAAIARGA